MSEIKVNSIKGVGASTAAITVNNTDGSCAVNNTQRQGKNLIINGDFQIAQRNTSATAEGYATVDRFSLHHCGEDEDCTQSQHSLTSSDTSPYQEGFRHSYHIQNGNQTSGGDNSDFCYIRQKIEGRQITNSGWNYTSASSNITLSFWVKSSVAFNSLCYAQTFSGTDYVYPFETGNLSANTWTKITKTIPGNSNLVFDADNNQGIQITWGMYWGSDFTDNSTSLNTWAAYDSTQRLPDMASTWWTTNDATFEITGVQLEVGSVATDFEHRLFAQELSLCERYYAKYVNLSTGYGSGNGYARSTHLFRNRMRAAPSRTITNTNVGSLNSSSANEDSVMVTWQSLSGTSTGEFTLELDSEL